MIVGERVEKLEVNVAKRPERAGFNMNVRILDVKEDGKYLDVKYEHTIKYTHGDAEIKIIGHLFMDEDEKTKKELLESWKKNKKLPNDRMEQVLNSANYLATVYGTVVSRVVNIAPPIIPLRLKLKG
jgi:hypothetical protein